ncbi:MAG: cohesin domain-containing protein, partial [Methylomonas lenta]|nr:cohesin domain-containing protein [Methylomonas lenta]
DRVPVITTTSTSTGFVSESVSYVDVGLKLDVEPTIYLDEDVAIKVNLEVSSIVREVLSKSGSLSYQIGTRGANTMLRLKDGETQILAGLISSEERSAANKVPYLGELPIIGRLFKSQKDDSQRSEILLSITPRIIRSIKRPDLMMAEFDSGTDTYIGAEELSLSTIVIDSSKIENTGDNQGKVVGLDNKNVIKAEISDTKTNQNRPAEGVAKTQLAETFSNVTFAWDIPAKVKVGEQFSAVLNINSSVAIKNLPVLIGFDPQLMQIVNVQEGDFFKQNQGDTRFTQRSDTLGKVFASVVRQSEPNDNGTNGIGKVLTVTFKAIKPTAANDTKLQLLSASPEPALTNPVQLPVEKSLQIAP